MSKRRYGQACVLAHALDRVGDRWAMLIVRELLLGPERFTDLLEGIPGIGSAVLSMRLKELEEARVLTRRWLPPPTSAWVYELTDYGRDLEDALMALARWGARARPSVLNDRPMRVEWMMLALKVMFVRGVPGAWTGVAELRIDHQSFEVAVSDTEIDVRRGEAARPDLRVKTDLESLRAVLWRRASVDEVIAEGRLAAGDNSHELRRFVARFHPLDAHPIFRDTAGEGGFARSYEMSHAGP